MPFHQIRNGRIDLRYVLLDEIADPVLLDRFRSTLSADELERLRRFTNAEASRQFLVGRAMLRETLAEWSGTEPGKIEFQYNAYGKPSLKSPDDTPLEFNVSHTRGLAICAVTSLGPLGVDVEHKRKVSSPLGIARRFFAPAEAERLERLPPERRDLAFLEQWTLREALVKARGVGIFTDPADFTFTVGSDLSAAVEFNDSIGEKAEDWQFRRLRPAEGYLAALAVKIRSQ